MKVEALPKISIVTISYNQGKYLEETILSVLNQNYPNLEYIIIDGGSKDNSVEIIQKYADQLTYWVSEPDNGQYHAVEKGLNMCTGDIMAWINSDDKYVPGAFKSVADLFRAYPNVNWIRGLPLECSEKGVIFNRIAHPWARWSKYRYLTFDFQFIQQESTFWKKKVWDEAGRCMDHSIQYAGDMELWARFFKKEKLYTVMTHLAVFRHRGRNQISKAHLVDYLLECISVIKRERKRLSFFEKLKVLFLYPVRIFWGPFFFFNVPVLKWIYPLFFSIPPAIGHGLKKSGYRKSSNQIRLPPFILGKWVIQKKPIRLKPKQG